MQLLASGNIHTLFKVSGSFLYIKKLEKRLREKYVILISLSQLSKLGPKLESSNFLTNRLPTNVPNSPAINLCDCQPVEEVSDAGTMTRNV